MNKAAAFVLFLNSSASAESLGPNPEWRAKTNEAFVVEGFVHWYGTYHPGDSGLTTSPNHLDSSGIFFGPNRSLWSYDSNNSLVLQRFDSHGHQTRFPLLRKTFKALDLAPSGTYDNTHEEYWNGNIVGFDHGDPLLSFDGRLIRYRDGHWSRVSVPGWGGDGKFVEVRSDGSLVLKESGGAVTAIRARGADEHRWPLGKGEFVRAIGAGKGDVIVGVRRGPEDRTLISVWRVSLGSAKLMATRRGDGFVLGSDGIVYVYWSGGTYAHPHTRKQLFYAWTRIEPLDDATTKHLIKLKGEVSPADIDLRHGRVWGVRVEVGHFGEPFVEFNLKNGRSRVLGTNTVGAVRRYDRLATDPSSY